METKNNEENGVLRERFALAMERIGEIAGEATVPEAYQPYFRRTAGFILTMEGLYGEIKNGHTEKYTLEEWQTLNWSLYQDILPEHYEKSYANPDYALEQLGETHSRLLCFLYTELRTMIVSAFEQRLEERVYLSMLYDFYGALLKENNRRIFEAYIQEDYSISEIAEEMEISRQAVHDAVKRITKQLKGYEEKLGLLERFEQQRSEMRRLHECLQEMNISETDPRGQEIFQILSKIIEE